MMRRAALCAVTALLALTVPARAEIDAAATAATNASDVATTLAPLGGGGFAREFM